mmetsp:Transcript_9614/g.28236  ORF Transcript_9614/g.28236 Transcript_9614/m.28236 type:complete len:204 (+) Transcript_9614:1792-2403(+)
MRAFVMYRVPMTGASGRRVAKESRTASFLLYSTSPGMSSGPSSLSDSVDGVRSLARAWPRHAMALLNHSARHCCTSKTGVAMKSWKNSTKLIPRDASICATSIIAARSSSFTSISTACAARSSDAPRISPVLPLSMLQKISLSISPDSLSALMCSWKLFASSEELKTMRRSFVRPTRIASRVPTLSVLDDVPPPSMATTAATS